MAMVAADTAWVLISSALVLLFMTPGLAFFYRGMVRRKNVLGSMIHSFIAMGIIAIEWVVIKSEEEIPSQTGNCNGNHCY